VTTRREFLTASGAGVCLLAAPLGSLAQQPGKAWRIGYLSAGGLADAYSRENLDAFRAGMRELGYVEGRNLAIELRFADGKFERLPGLAVELADLNVDVILTFGTPGVSAARRATTTIPIVTGSFGDPVGSGFAASLSRPGGNVTGLTSMGEELYAKRLEMLLSVAPKVTRIAVLVNPDNAFFEGMLSKLKTDAQKMGREIVPVRTREARELDEGFSLMVRQRAGALIVGDDVLLNTHASRIAELALRHRLPSIFAPCDSVEAGGLMCYGADIPDRYRRAAIHVGKILKGAKPGDLPIEQPTKFELVVNRKTAKALGVTIPQSILVRADKVIE
jgi:ABC-type uncharacterized transport system substrate-binding protein